MLKDTTKSNKQEGKYQTVSDMQASKKTKQTRHPIKSHYLERLNSYKSTHVNDGG